jgi:uncharacterized damage-inducible protein DinB
MSNSGQAYTKGGHFVAEDNFTLTIFYSSWKEYQDHIKDAIIHLNADQVELRAASHLRSIVENVLHIIGCRAYWFTDFLGEDFGVDVKEYAGWDIPGAPIRTIAEMVKAIDRTWECMVDCLNRWNLEDMQQTFPDTWEGNQVDLSRAWVVWHVMEHDLHHGGEVSLTLGIHGLKSNFPG